LDLLWEEARRGGLVEVPMQRKKGREAAEERRNWEQQVRRLVLGERRSCCFLVRGSRGSHRVSAFDLVERHVSTALTEIVLLEVRRA